MIRQFAAVLLELAAEALRPPVPTEAQEEERASLIGKLETACRQRAALAVLAAELRDELDACHADRIREKARADAAVSKAEQFERDWYDAKSEFGTARAKGAERIRGLEARIAELEQLNESRCNAATELHNRIAELEQQLKAERGRSRLNKKDRKNIRELLEGVASACDRDFGDVGDGVNEALMSAQSAIDALVVDEKEADGHDA